MKSKSLGELEMRIMGVVWEHGECSVNEVLNGIKNDKKIAIKPIEKRALSLNRGRECSFSF